MLWQGAEDCVVEWLTTLVAERPGKGGHDSVARLMILEAPGLLEGEAAGLRAKVEVRHRAGFDLGVPYCK